LRQTGGVSIYLGGNPRFETVAAQIGAHPWAQFSSGAVQHRKFMPAIAKPLAKAKMSLAITAPADARLGHLSSGG
jgi:hypothetical protein